MTKELTKDEPALSGFFNAQHAKAFALEQAIRNELPIVEREVVNHFSHGVYGREPGREALTKETTWAS